MLFICLLVYLFNYFLRQGLSVLALAVFKFTEILLPLPPCTIMPGRLCFDVVWAGDGSRASWACTCSSPNCEFQPLPQTCSLHTHLLEDVAMTGYPVSATHLWVPVWPCRVEPPKTCSGYRNCVHLGSKPQAAMWSHRGLRLVSHGGCPTSWVQSQIRGVDKSMSAWKDGHKHTSHTSTQCREPGQKKAEETERAGTGLSGGLQAEQARRSELHQGVL